MKYLKKFEQLTYEQSVRLSKVDTEIKNYIEKNYPQHGYKMPKNYITFSRELGAGQLRKIKSLAKKENDSTLLQLIDKLDTVNLPQNIEGEKFNL